MFIARGYEGATTKDIAAAAAGIHEATLFRKYGTKAGLIERAIQHQFTDVPMANLEYTGDMVADLVAIVDAYLTTNEQSGEVMQALLMQAPQHPELKHAMATVVANIGGIVNIIQQYQAQGRLQQEKPFTTLSALFGPLMANLLLRRAIAELPIPAIDSQAHVAGFLNGKGI